MTRVQRLAALLEEPLLVAGPPYVLGGQANVRYLTGLQSSNAAVLVEPDGSATLYTDFRYANRARSIGGFEVVETARGLIPAIGELLTGRRILIEEQHLPHAFFRALVDAGVDADSGHGPRGDAPRSEGRRRDRVDAPRERALGRSVRRARTGAVQRAQRARARVVDRAELPRRRRRRRLLRGRRRRGSHGSLAARGAGRRADRGGCPRRRRRRLRPRRLLLGLHADVRGRRDLGAALRAVRALSRGPARRARGRRSRRARPRRRRSVARAHRGGRSRLGVRPRDGTRRRAADPRGADAPARVDRRPRSRERRLRRARDLPPGRGASACGSRISSS